MFNRINRVVGAVLSLALFLVASQAQAQGVFPAPEAFPNLRLEVAGSVNAIVRYSDGGTDYYLIGGRFDLVGGEPRSNLARLLADGSPDPAWTAGTNATVHALAVAGGQLFVGGEFGLAGGQPRNRLAKFDLATAQLDAGWNPDANNTVFALQTDGSSVWAGGLFNVVGGTSRALVARIDAASGGVVQAFNAGVGGNAVYALLLDGTDLYVGGQGRMKGNQRALIKVAAESGAAIVWNPGIGPQGGSRVRALAADGSTVYATGRIRRADNTARGNGARFLKSNAALQAWNPAADAEVLAVALDAATASAFIAGDFLNAGGSARLRLARTDATSGAVNAGWVANADRQAVSLLADGGFLLAGGSFAEISGTGAQGGVSRLATGDAAIDGSFVGDAAGVGTVRAYALDADGGVILGGSFDVARQEGSVTPFPRRNLLRLLPVGGLDPQYALDPAWSASTLGEVLTVAVAGADLYVGGNFTQVNGVARNRLARLVAATAVLDPAWLPGANGGVRHLLPDAGSVYVAGDFTLLNATARAGLGRLDAGGATDAGWNPNPDNSVEALLAADGGIYVAGGFTSIGGAAKAGVARVNATDGAADGGFSADLDVDGVGFALHRSTSGLYIGGQFSSVNGSARLGLARFVADTLDAGWSPGVGAGSVHALAVDETESFVYIGGQFATAGGESHLNLARATVMDGTVDPAWRPGTDGLVQQMSVPQAGQVLFAGAFSSVTNEERNAIALLGEVGSDITEVVDISFAPLAPNAAIGEQYTVSFAVHNVSNGSTPSGSVAVTSVGGTPEETNTCSQLSLAVDPMDASRLLGSFGCTSALAGAHLVTIEFTGDAAYLDSSASASYDVARAPTSIGISFDPASVVFGQTFQATISFSPLAVGDVDATGTIAVPGCTPSSFAIGDLVGGQATCDALAGSAGVLQTITASYGGDANFAPSSGNASTTPAKADSAFSAFSGSPLAIETGDSVDFSWAVAAVAPGSGTPAGDVLVSVGGTPVAPTCSGTVAAGTCTITFATHGTFVLRADYAGNADFNASTASNTVTVVVTPTQADLQVVKLVSRSLVDRTVPIEFVEFTIVVGNAGPADVVGARVVDTLDTTLASNASWNCVGDGGGAACQAPSGTGNIDVLVDLPSGTTATLVLLAQVVGAPQSGVPNTVSVAAPSGVTDPDLANNLSTAWYQACFRNVGGSLSPHFCLFTDGFEPEPAQ